MMASSTASSPMGGGGGQEELAASSVSGKNDSMCACVVDPVNSSSVSADETLSPHAAMTSAVDEVLPLGRYATTGCAVLMEDGGEQTRSNGSDSPLVVVRDLSAQMEEEETCKRVLQETTAAAEDAAHRVEPNARVAESLPQTTCASGGSSSSSSSSSSTNEVAVSSSVVVDSSSPVKPTDAVDAGGGGGGGVEVVVAKLASVTLDDGTVATSWNGQCVSNAVVVQGEEENVIKLQEEGIRISEEEPEEQEDIAKICQQQEPSPPKAELPAECVPDSFYQVKWVKWKDSKVPVITQNENGPCPLIAIINVLLLLGKVKLSHMIDVITSSQLMEYLGDCILENAPKNISEGAQLNYEQNMHDAIAILPKLQTGLDVNVKFTGVHDFEYTPECIIFDLLNIPLYHGWLVDPQAKDVVLAVGKLGYNQLVEKIITNKSSQDSDLVTEALIAEAFLEKSASQLTYYGLCELNEVLKPKELAVLFRNNHFSTIFKHEAELLQLVTDQGFLNECSVVWETLTNIEGDCQFVDANFATVPPKAIPTAAAATASGVAANNAEQIHHDYLVALSLQEEQKRQEEKAKVWQEYKEKELGATADMTDEELAWRLQVEEEKQANQSQPEAVQRSASASCAAAATPGDVAQTRTRQPSTESRSGRTEKKKSECSIL